MGEQGQVRRAAAPGAGDRPGVRFGRTVVDALVGDPLDQGVECVVVAANRRGVLGTSARRAFGDGSVERSTMAAAPLDLGSVVATDPAALGARGVRVVLHAVVHPLLGEPARPEDVRRATTALLAAADRHKVHSLAMPLLGVDGHDAADPGPAVTAMIDELIGCLRRGVAHPERILVLARYPDHVDLLARAIDRARARLWPSAL